MMSRESRRVFGDQLSMAPYELAAQEGINTVRSTAYTLELFITVTALVAALSRKIERRWK